MLKKTLVLLGLILLTTQNVYAEEEVSVNFDEMNEASVNFDQFSESSVPGIGRQECIPFCFHISGTYLFEGDNKGEFAGDYVAVLEDGSAWKIHPEDAQTYATWTRDDIVQPQARTSFYWFKREHKFLLRNYTRNENLRVMLVGYPAQALYIVSVQYVATGGHWEHKQYEDAYGNKTVIAEWVLDYVKNLYLNDGTIWCVPNDSHYTAGRFVATWFTE